MMNKLIVIGLMAYTLSTRALPPVPAQEQSEPITLTNATIHIGNGQVLHNAQLAFEKGKITRVGHFKALITGSTINLQGKHVYPGLILSSSNIGLIEIDAVKATNDYSETGQINPNIRSVIAYNTDSERIPPLRFNGVLLAQTTPQGGVISGTSSVVQLDAWNWQDAIIKMDDALHINWPSSWKKQFDWNSFSLSFKEDEKYQEKISAIKSLFNDSRYLTTTNNLKLATVHSVWQGDKGVHIHTNDPKAIIESITYLKSLGIINIVLVTGQAAGVVIDFLKNADIPVIIAGVHTLPQSDDSRIDEAFDLPFKLAKAGIEVSLTYPDSMNSRNLPFIAGTTVAYGNGKEEALKMITLNPAKALGIDAIYGSLEAGKSATLFITEGDALDMRGNIVTDAYIDGRKIDLNGQQQRLNEIFTLKYKQ